MKKQALKGKKQAFKAAFKYLTASDRGLEKAGLQKFVTAVNLRALFTPSKLPSLDTAMVVRKGALQEHEGINSASATLIREEWSRYLATTGAQKAQRGKSQAARTRSASGDRSRKKR
jgi:hypothetical protein